MTLLRRGGADVEYGNLLSLPVSGGLLYVEPVYVRASQGQGYPLLRKVLVNFGDTTVLRNSLGEALAAVFSGSGTGTGTGTDTGGGDTGGGDAGTPTDDAQADLVKAIADAQAAYQKGEDALAAGDFAAYGKAQDELKAALDRAAAAQRRITGDSVAEPPADGGTSGEPPATDAPSTEPSDGGHGHTGQHLTRPGGVGRPARSADLLPSLDLLPLSEADPPKGKADLRKGPCAGANPQASEIRGPAPVLPRLHHRRVRGGAQHQTGRGFGRCTASAATTTIRPTSRPTTSRAKGQRQGSGDDCRRRGHRPGRHSPGLSAKGALGYGALELGYQLRIVFVIGHPDVLRGPGLQAHDHGCGRSAPSSPGARWRWGRGQVGSAAWGLFLSSTLAGRALLR